jgi:ubiquinone/menaquinone biosynthesis C-methylase UbiE
MAVPFDHITATSDEIFTPSAIGQLQRKQVWDYLSRVTPQLNGLDILELNCGSGDDALLFGDKDFNIVATDVSTEMMKVSEAKAPQYSLQHTISTKYLDLDSFNENLFHKKFDLIFSNFGGISSINPETLKKFLQKIPSVLAPGGRFIAVIMPRFCLWESMYFLSRCQFRKMFRRWTKEEAAGFGKHPVVKTWFYKPSEIISWSKNRFKVVQVRPVGFALPPLCFENVFSFRKGLLLTLNGIEQRFNRVSLFSRISDHFLIDLQLR